PAPGASTPARMHETGILAHSRDRVAASQGSFTAAEKGRASLGPHADPHPPTRTARHPPRGAALLLPDTDPHPPRMAAISLWRRSDSASCRLRSSTSARTAWGSSSDARPGMAEVAGGDSEDSA